VYDPVTDYLDQTLDVRFIPAYEKAFDRGRELVASGEYAVGTDKSFKRGHENFLMNAMVYEYFYGDKAEAQRLFDKARDLYADEPYNAREGRYDRTLKEMVTFEQVDNIDTMQGARQAIDGYLAQAFMKGLANGRIEPFHRFVEMAKFVNDHWAAGKQKTINVTTDQGRMLFGNWPKPLYDGFIHLLRSPRMDILLKLRLWNNALAYAPDLNVHAYDQVKSTILQQLEQRGYDAERAFPPPPGIEAFRAQRGGELKSPEKELQSPLRSNKGRVRRQ